MTTNKQIFNGAARATVYATVVDVTAGATGKAANGGNNLTVLEMTNNAVGKTTADTTFASVYVAIQRAVGQSAPYVTTRAAVEQYRMSLRRGMPATDIDVIDGATDATITMATRSVDQATEDAVRRAIDL